MMPQTADVTRLLSTAKYRYQEQAKRDINNALTHYRNLTPIVDKYVFPDGNQKDLVCLRGTIPVSYRGAIYNIPVCIWLTDSHPYSAPLCYVNPTQDMTIKVSKHVDQSGRIFLPYLSEWKANTSDLLGVIQVMIIVFGETPPVYSKPRNVAPNATNMSPAQDTSIGATNILNPYSNAGYPMPRMTNAAVSTSTPYPTQYPSQYPFSTSSYPQNSTASPYTPQTGTTNYPAYPIYSSAGYGTQSATTQSGAQQNSSTGTITEEHIRASLLSAVEDKIKQRLKEKIAQFQAEIDVLKKTGDDLSKGKTKLEDIIRRMEDEMVELNDCNQQLNAMNSQLSELVSKCDDTEKTVDIDEAFGPTQPLYKQLLNAFSEENAVVDAIYYLGEALRKEVIDLEIFLKHVRELSRRQFMLRALMKVCREKAGLPCC